MTPLLTTDGARAVTPLLTFAPDADPMKPGVITDCSDMIPTTDGVAGAPPWTDYTTNASATAIAAATLTDPTYGDYFYLGTATKTFYAGGTGTVVVDASRAGNYTLGANDSWCFEQFGRSALAATPTAKIQYQTTMGSGSFADISTAPQAKLIKAASGFVVAFNTSASTDTWYCSAINDPTDWTLSVSTQCVTGRLIDTPGAIVEAQRLGNDLVAFKRNSTYVGRYVGAPVVWQWTRVSESIGCVEQGASCSTPFGVFFVGPDNIYVFDGTVPRSIADGAVARWLFIGNQDKTAREMETAAALPSTPTLAWDELHGLVWIHYKRTSDTTFRSGLLAYNPKTGKWGRGDKTGIACVFAGLGMGIYSARGRTLCALKTSGQLTMRGYLNRNTSAQIAGDSSFTTGLLGTDGAYTHCRNVRVRYAKLMASPTVSCQGYVVDQSGAAVTAGASSTSLSDGRHNVRQTGRWHQFKFTYTGTAYEATGVKPELAPAGTR